MLVFVIFTGMQVCALSVIPGGNGFGMETPAGRGGKVLRVTNLNPDGKGSLKAAIDADGPRVVIFEVSGNIEIKGRLTIVSPFITIAGQTAPSPGITLKECTLTINTHDVLIQHLRIRTGDLGGVNPDVRDAVNIGLNQPTENLYNIVVDHCSVSWGIDENVEARGCSNISWNHCIISEPLSHSIHSKGEHSKAFLVENAKNISLIGNIIAHSRDRNPVIKSGVKGVLANNLIYNPGEFNIRIASFKDVSEISIVGNVAIGGENSSRTARLKLPTIWRTPKVGTKIYLSDNSCDKGTSSSSNDWRHVRNATDISKSNLLKNVRVTSPPVWLNGFTAKSSSQVKKTVFLNAGARPVDRDLVDQRIIKDIRTGKGGIINTPSEVGGWPDLPENRRKLALPANPNEDSDEDGYTNLEEWLHEVAMQVEGRHDP